MSDKPVILVVDDDKNTRDGLQRALQRHYDVKTAESADAALAILAAEPEVDVMLSDLRMPGTDGAGPAAARERAVSPDDLYSADGVRVPSKPPWRR